MSRMLEALKTLEARRPGAPQATAEPAPAVQVDWQSAQDVAAAAEAEIVEIEAMLSLCDPPAPAPPVVACCLPTTLEVSDHYLELAATIDEQLASSYCSVLLFACPDRRWETSFSLTHLAQAVSLQSPGEVLLVDGDLRGRWLSTRTGVKGPGLGEVMFGSANWTDVIYPTNTSGIDFVACGSRQVPTLERAEFGWNALRPQYRSVLIGVSPAGQPDTDWLAARCDGVYLLVSRPYTKRQAASAAVNSLRASGANVLGCIVLDD